MVYINSFFLKSKENNNLVISSEIFNSYVKYILE